MSLQLHDTATKRIEMLREVVRGLRRLAAIANAVNPSAALEMREVQTAASALDLEITTFEIRRPEDIATAFEALRGRAEALYVCTDPLMNTSRVHINKLALDARLPSVCGFREFVDAGGFISYGACYPALFRRTAEIVDKTLRGTKPGRCPGRAAYPIRIDYQPQDRQGSLGLTVPETLLATADEVIQ